MPNCTWYTFIPEDAFCSLFLTCSEINEDACGTCVSGKKTAVNAEKYLFGENILWSNGFDVNLI